MTYVAVKGGREAIENAIDYFRYQQVKGNSAPLHAEQIREQLHLAVDRVMGEGSLYAPDLAALSIKQAAGDTFEAAFMLRAYRTTEPRLGYSIPQDSEQMRVIRRISAAFKEIPGGQVLGPTSDYRLRLLNFDLVDEQSEDHRERMEELFGNLVTERSLPDTFPKVVDILREEGLLMENRRAKEEDEPTDVRGSTFVTRNSGAWGGHDDPHVERLRTLMKKVRGVAEERGLEVAPQTLASLHEEADRVWQEKRGKSAE